MKLVIWILVAGLIIAHQDYWNWTDDTLFWGFLPIGLAYHIGLSLVASCVWLFACSFAWPKGVDDFEHEGFEGKVETTQTADSTSEGDKGGEA